MQFTPNCIQNDPGGAATPGSDTEESPSVHINLTAHTRLHRSGQRGPAGPSPQFTARGILGYLLSLPDGAREDVRTLADKNPGLGRRGVAKALDELVALGYYVRRTVRDEISGQVRTETHVSTGRHSRANRFPSRRGPAVRSTAIREAPKGKKNGEEYPPSPTRSWCRPRCGAGPSCCPACPRGAPARPERRRHPRAGPTGRHVGSIWGPQRKPGPSSPTAFHR